MRTDKPSKTARKVALNVVSLGARRGMGEVLPPGVVDATAALLVESGAVGRRAVRFARSPVAVGIFLAFDWMMPGQFEAFAYRKAFCELQARKGIGGGARQVLVLGAGYDTLGWRLAPEFPAVDFFEIDEPATAHRKAKGVEAMGPRANLHLLAEDLGERQLVEVLHADATWDSAVPSVVIAEGLLMYLPPEAVGALLQQCSESSGPGSRLVFTYVRTRPDGRPDAGPCTPLALWLLRVGGEPWLWSMPAEGVGSFLGDHGWRLDPDFGESPEKRGVELFGAGVR